MYIATSSIPREQLSRILYRALDPKNPDQRLRIVRLYLQAERYQDARLELEQILKDFPGLAELQQQVKMLRQLSAQRLLKEIALRREAGQHALAMTMLRQFPSEGVAGETLLEVRDALAEMESRLAAGQRAIDRMNQQLAAIQEDRLRAELQPVLEEIRAELSLNTLGRLADFLRLADDASLTPQQKLSLAISGWLMGEGAGLDNLSVTRSLFAVRQLVRRYLTTSRQAERDEILAQLASLEGATPEYVAKIIAHMKPPLPLPVPMPASLQPAEPAPAAPAAAAPPAARGAAAEGESGCGDAAGDQPSEQPPPRPAGADQPPGAPPPGPMAPAAAPPPAGGGGEAAAAGAIPGLIELTVPTGLAEEPEVRYWVQLPPEYDPYRRYPCIVTLSGAATTPLQQIDWWAGSYQPAAGTRFGQATRHGYLVLAPQWLRPHQRQYEYSAREHAAVLVPLRDACKRFAIDTDRVFLSGHSIGGDAAWDIGLAHPDLWAGVIPIVATAGKYVTHYWRNAEYVPLYFVSGEKDGDKRVRNAMDWDRYLTHSGYDVMIVEYQGRGHEDFHDDIQNLFTWMNLHRRNFFPREFSVDALRPWDHFFWWVETAQPRPANMILPAEWGDGPTPEKTPRPAKTTAKVLANNGLSVQSGWDKVTVWLSPELVTFNDTLRVTINNRRQTKIQPSLQTLLEDVRTRGDRQHPFWAKVEN
jgi:predicted esterase/tetratricopeptide (TPR) repeat protein